MLCLTGSPKRFLPTSKKYLPAVVTFPLRCWTLRKTSSIIWIYLTSSRSRWSRSGGVGTGSSSGEDGLSVTVQSVLGRAHIQSTMRSLIVAITYLKTSERPTALCSAQTIYYEASLGIMVSTEHSVGCGEMTLDSPSKWVSEQLCTPCQLSCQNRGPSSYTGEANGAWCHTWSFAQ